MRNNKRCWWVAGTRLIITLALQMVVGVAFGQTAQESSSYTFIVVDVPAPDGQLGFTDLRDINDKGQLVGGATAGPHGFLLDGFEFTAIQCSDVDGSAALSINKRGDIAGFCGSHGFRRRHNGKYTLLDFPGAFRTEASGINDEGDVVGDYVDSAGYHGFFWDEGQFWTIDVPFPEATNTNRLVVNNVGQIVGTYLDTSGNSHGFLYDDGVFRPIDVPDAMATDAADINDRGQIVGMYILAGSAIHHGYQLDNDTFTTIDAPFPEVTGTDAEGINNKGQIAGRFFGPSFGSRGLVATPNQNSTLVTSSLSQPGVKK